MPMRNSTTRKSGGRVKIFIAYAAIVISVGFASARRATAEGPDSSRIVEINRLALSQSSDKSSNKYSNMMVAAANNYKNKALKIIPLSSDESKLLRIRSFVEMSDGEIGLFEDLLTPNSRSLRFDRFQEQKIDQYANNPKQIGWFQGGIKYSYGIGEANFISLGDHKLTFYKSEEGIDFHDIYLFSECADPAASYFTDEYHGQLHERVLIVRLERDVRVFGDIQCEEELFQPPHDHVRIIDPFLIAVPAGEHSIFLAGGSYASMPFVIKYDADTGIIGDDISVFVVEKAVIDQIRQAASDEYYSIMQNDREHNYAAAGLAALIETRISEYLSKTGAK